jgi:carbon storage regulator CsrA
MLVLSRRPNEKILFPNLGITVQVLRSNGNVTRLGIEAPQDVRIIREEISDQQPPTAMPERPMHAPSSELRHAIRNRLNTAVLGLHLLHRKLEMGQLQDTEAAVMKVIHELQGLDSEMGPLIQSPAENDSLVPRRRALLVDDSRNESELMAGYLRTFDYEVDIANDGLEAIAYLEAHQKPDVVLLDMQMPRLNGPETICRIRANRAFDGIRVFAVSGLSAEQAGVEIGPAGVDRWFTKPIKPNELVDEMHRDLAVL